MLEAACKFVPGKVVATVCAEETCETVFWGWEVGIVLGADCAWVKGVVVTGTSLLSATSFGDFVSTEIWSTGCAGFGLGRAEEVTEADAGAGKDVGVDTVGSWDGGGSDGTGEIGRLSQSGW